MGGPAPGGAVGYPRIPYAGGAPGGGAPTRAPMQLGPPGMPSGPPGAVPLPGGPPPGFVNPPQGRYGPNNLTGPPDIPSGGLPGFAGGAGQAARPAPPAPQPAAPAPPPAGPAAMTPGSGMPQLGSMSIKELATQLVQANPGVPPEVIGAAMTKALPFLTAQDQQYWRSIEAQMQRENLDIQRRRAESYEESVRARPEIAAGREEGLDRRAQLNIELRRDIEVGREKRAELSAETRKSIAQLNAETRSVIAKNIEAGRDWRTGLSVDARKDVAKLNADSRKEIQEIAEEGRDRRLGVTEAGKSERVGAQQAGATERVEMQQKGAGERVAAQQAGAKERTQIGAASRETIARQSLEFKTQAFNRTSEQRDQQFAQKQELARQKIESGKPSETDVEAVAQGIANYRQAPYTGVAARSAAGLRVMDRVYQLNKGYDAANWRAHSDAITRFTSGVQGNTIRSLRVADDHLQTLGALAQLLNNGDAKAYNTLKNYLNKQVWGYPEVTSFDAARQIVAAEVIKAVSATGGGVAERLQAQQPIDVNASPAQIKGAIGTYRRLMAGQLKGFKAQYESIPGNAQNFEEQFKFDPKAFAPEATSLGGAAQPGSKDQSRVGGDTGGWSIRPIQ